MKRLLLFLLPLLLVCGCAAQNASARQCRLVLEDGEGFRAEHSAVTVRQGADAVFYLTPEDGYTFVGADYEDYTVEEQGNRQVLTLRGVRYSETVTVQYALSGPPICYDGNGGRTADGAETVSVGSITTHLRSNTAIGIAPPSGGTLTRWAEQGVLLLNSVLTVCDGAANSHKGWGWERFTTEILRETVRLPHPVAYLLWGRCAQAKAEELHLESSPYPRLVLRANHPSPLSASRGFFGSRPFSQVNAFLREHGEAELQW